MIIMCERYSNKLLLNYLLETIKMNWWMNKKCCMMNKIGEQSV